MSDNQALNAEMPQNPDIVQARIELNLVFYALLECLSKATDEAEKRSLTIEIGEVNHRNLLLSQVEFARATLEIKKAAKKVGAGKQAAVDALESQNSLLERLKAVSTFLAVVDKLVDLAKAFL